MKELFKEPISEYNPDINLTTIEARQEAAERFIESLPSKPIVWKLSGSSAEGTFRPNSDVDITAFYENESDIPYNEIFDRMDENGLIDG